MTKQGMWGAALGSVAAILVSIAVAPLLVGAQEGREASNAKDDVIARPSDSPLQRQAKLQRTWAVYRQASSTQIWAITKEGEKREVKTLDFFSAFDANYLVKLVSGERLEALPTGEPITSIQGLSPEQFVKSPFACRLMKTSEQPAVYLACGTKRRAVIREGVFHQFGWEFRDVETVSEGELASHEEGDPVTEATVFEEDVEVETTENRELTEQVQKRLELRGKRTGRDRLIKSPDDARVFMLDKNGKRRHVKDMAAVRRHGLNMKDVTEISQDELEAIPEGDQVTADTSQAELTQ